MLNIGLQFFAHKKGGKGSDDPLFAMKSGRVKFERLGKDRKQVSIVEIAQ